jgi:hypothetical protein
VPIEGTRIDMKLYAWSPKSRSKSRAKTPANSRKPERKPARRVAPKSRV